MSIIITVIDKTSAADLCSSFTNPAIIVENGFQIGIYFIFLLELMQTVILLRCYAMIDKTLFNVV